LKSEQSEQSELSPAPSGRTEIVSLNVAESPWRN
jgi:hypothetical protein